MKFKEYKTVLSKSTYEFEEKKSVFICDIINCKSEDEAVKFISEIKSKHRQANHVCHAYVIGENKLIQRYSDDGEPQGTAGIPMLEVLKKEDITNVCATVTRYYGGVKLGASGLIRAYSRACSLAIAQGSVVYMKNYKEISLIFDYTLIGKVDNYISVNDYYQIMREYTDKVRIDLYISEEEFEKFYKDITDLSKASCEIIIKNDLLLAENNRKIVKGE